LDISFSIFFFLSFQKSKISSVFFIFSSLRSKASELYRSISRKKLTKAGQNPMSFPLQEIGEEIQVDQQ
jgi:hypothetical protein